METENSNVIVIMGVSGIGKTTIGELLSEKLSLPFYDADDFHTDENIAKMENGEPLTDEDREPWLNTLAKKMNGWSKGFGAILACSALKESYRQTLNTSKNSIVWVYLYGKYDVVKERLENREDHYFNAALLESQFKTLQPPKYGIHINAHQKPESIVKIIIQKISEDE